LNVAIKRTMQDLVSWRCRDKTGW